MSKILLVIPTLDRSGAEKQFCLIAEGLQLRGHQVQLIALTRGGALEAHLQEAAISYTVLNKRLRFDINTLKSLRKIIREFTPDAILSCLFAGNAYARLATIGLKRPRPRILVSERCVDSWKSGWQLTLDRALRSRTDLLIGNSESVAQFYQAKGYSKEKVRVIPNGVAIPATPQLSRSEFCQQVKVPEDARFIAYIGRLAPQKRVQDLLWAMQMLRMTQPNTYLLIIGDGPQRCELEEYARVTEAATHTRFLGHREDAASLLHYSEMFWLASEFEGMSNSLMEAMACGKPVVVSDISPNRELVEHGKDGWLVNLGDAAGYTQYAERLLKNPEEGKSLGEHGAQKMREQFSVEKMIECYAELLETEVRQ